MRKFLKHGFDVVGGADGLRQHELWEERTAEHCRGEVDEHAGFLEGKKKGGGGGWRGDEMGEKN